MKTNIALLISLLIDQNKAATCTGANSAYSLCTSGNCGSTTTECTAGNCIAGYGIFSADKICRACGAGASACDANAQTATACFPGFYLDTGKCLKCPNMATTNAATCSGTGGATIASCKPGYSLISSACVKCTKANAKLCASSADTVTACMDGYQLASGSCSTACGTGIKKCNTSATAPDGSGDCLPGYFFTSASPNTCSACGTNALTCTSNSVALSCKVGFGINSNACTACTSSNTATCTTNTVGNSLSCTSEFFAASNNCNGACGTGGDKCDSATSSITCKAKYALIGTAKVCAACTATDCDDCSHSALDTCFTCSSGGYSLTSANKNCCKDGHECLTCSATPGTDDCLSCPTNFALNATSKKCEINLAASCSGNNCSIVCGAGNCGTDYCDKTKCTACHTQDMKVMVGAYPSSGVSWPTVGECQQVADCPTGHAGNFNHAGVTGTPQAGTNKVPQICLPCQASNCNACQAASATNVTQTCTGCASGYTLTSGACVKAASSDSTANASSQSNTSGSSANTTASSSSTLLVSGLVGLLGFLAI